MMQLSARRMVHLLGILIDQAGTYLVLSTLGILAAALYRRWLGALSAGVGASAGADAARSPSRTWSRRNRAYAIASR